MMDTGVNTVYTLTANCQDCYRCVRACPVKAISVSGGQAAIKSELCIQCGTCVRECPQGAKKIRSDLDAVKALIASGRAVAASVAPAFAAVYGGSLSGRLPGILRRLGFRYAAETAEGAKYVAERSFEPGQAGSICTACPSVINYIEKYDPTLKDSLIPVVSPMIAHGRLLKERYGGCAVVFIGPCAAKKEEILRPENAGAVDVAITFEELAEWLSEEGVSIENSVESGFDSAYHVGDARLFPLEGGMLRTGGVECGTTDIDHVKISGAENVIALFGDRNALSGADVIEPLFCKGGCIGGPAMPKSKTLFERQRDVVDYWRRSAPDAAQRSAAINSKAEFADRNVNEKEVSESQIDKILEQTGKLDPANQLNCEACGYKSCKANARAIALGMAEPEMCIPYMRRLALQRSDRIIETEPNGVVVLDSELNMIKMNPAFQKMFMCNNSILGRRISYLVNADGFESLQSGAEDHYESIKTKYGIRYHEILFALREEGQYVGIYSDISKLKYDTAQLDMIKSQTLMHAREFLDHQIRFAQEMAHYLGKSTAQSEEIARKLIGLYETSDDTEESQ